MMLLRLPELVVVVGLAAVCAVDVASAQQAPDTLVLDTLSVRIAASQAREVLPEFDGTRMFVAKKTDLVRVTAGEINAAQNLTRMAFARIPGAYVWDMDGAGTQVNVGTRGTDAHRAIEMNMRQNGYNVSSDAVGYPETHYTPAIQAIDRIELVRGSASLQFGSQFGGMLNYVMKDGSPSHEFQLQSEQTIGSNNFFNSYNALGGTKGPLRYYAYFDNRHGDGWRPNGSFNYDAMYANVSYALDPRQTATLQFSRMTYRQQIAGGLTDSMFDQDPRQSNRSRNFFSPTINIPALTYRYEPSPRARIETTVSGLWGDRSSLQFINTPDVEDTINLALGTYNPRQIDRDYYKSFTVESRLLFRYGIGRLDGAITGGIRYFDGRTKRRQKGQGTTGSDFTWELTSGYGIDLRFSTHNYAAFAENMLRLSSRLALTAGARYEVIRSSLDGVIESGTFPVEYAGNRAFPLFGAGLQLQATSSTEVYVDAAQSYRPYLYAFITPADQVAVIDQDLRDTRGYQVDLGYRGRLRDLLTFDVSAFRVLYGERIGTLTLTAADNSTYLFTTNIGDAVAQGIESYFEISLLSPTGDRGESELRLFDALSYTHARYQKAALSDGRTNVSLDGNMVENVPPWTNRVGLGIEFAQLTATLQHTYVARQFSDASNTEFNPTASSGVVPAYGLWDASVDWRLFGDYSLSAGVNNIGDASYFSRRIASYPGPGILPGDGRTFYVSDSVGMN